MITIDPKDISTPDFHAFMLGAVSPRPIAFASTMNENGLLNLAPYSFFNAYSSKPPTLVFSSNRRVRDNSTKDTYHNIKATGEVVINAVSYNMVRQMALASIEYPSDVNEFEKAGFTPLPSVTVKPFRVAESPAQFECKVKQIIELGDEGGAGNLFICEVQLMHLHKAVLNDKGKIDPHKIDLCGRMGDNYYVRASGSAVFQLNQPVNKIGIGFDNLPDKIKFSKVLTGNDLAELASVESIPDASDFQPDKNLLEAINNSANSDKKQEVLHIHIRNLLQQGAAEDAWKTLISLKEY